MTIIYTILVFIIGLLIGKYLLRSKAPKLIGKSKPEMAEMRVEAHEAVVARTNKRKAKKS